MIPLVDLTRKLLVSAVIALAVLLPVYWHAVQLPSIGLFHDDGVYLSTAQSLAQGKGYLLANLPGEPPQTKYPPVFPAILSLILRTGSQIQNKVLIIKAFVALLGFVWFFASWALLRRLGTPPSLAFAIVFATAAAPWVVYISTTILSETLFATLCMCTLLCLERRVSSDPLPLRFVAGAAVLGAVATLTRSIGVALLAACLGWLLSKRQFRGAALFAAIAGACLAPWVLWIATHQGSGYYGSDNYRSWHIFSSAFAPGFGDKLAVLGTNLIFILSAPARSFAFKSNPLVLIAAVSLSILAARAVFRENRPTVWFAAAYLGCAACWMWPPLRFVVVILPLVLWLGTRGLETVAGRRTAWMAMGFLGLLGAYSAVGDWGNVQTARETGTLVPEGERERWSDVAATGAWLEANTPPNAVLAGNLDPLLYLLSGRRAVRGFEANPYRLLYSEKDRESAVGTASDMFANLENSGVDYLVESPNHQYLERPMLRNLIAALERERKLDAVFMHGEFRVLRVARTNGRPK